MYRFTFICGIFWGHISTIQRNESSFVAHSVTIIGSREDCDTFTIMCHLISIILKKNCSKFQHLLEYFCYKP